LANKIADEYLIKELENETQFTSFSCADKDLNDFLINNAKSNNDNLISKTYIYYNQVSEEIIGFISLSAYRLNLSNTIQFGLTQVPAVLLGRLAIDNNYRGKNLAVNLINYARGVCNEVKQLIGCRLLIVEVKVNNTNLVRYFLDRGFEIIHKSKKFYYLMIDLKLL